MKNNIELVDEIIRNTLEDYGRRGLFNGIHRLDVDGIPEYYINWHYRREITLRYVASDGVIAENILSNIHHQSEMENSLWKFIDKFSSLEMVAHRRVDSSRITVGVKNDSGNIGIKCRSRDGDVRYAVSSLLDIIHSIFLEFIPDGPYYEYQVNELGLNQDSIRLG